MIALEYLSEESILSELNRLGATLRDLLKDCEMSGSPGESIVERIDEIENILAQRKLKV